MIDIKLFNEITSLKGTSKKAALATVIRTRGSTPRKVGAKMLIYSNKEILGTIGGGCGEGEVIEKAIEVMNEGKSTTYHVDLTKGLFYEDGGICGGIQEIFIEPIN